MESIIKVIQQTGISLDEIARVSKEIDPLKKGIALRTLYNWINSTHEPRHSKLKLFVTTLNTRLEQSGKRKRIKVMDLIG
jgi:hypothetical protein